MVNVNYTIAVIEDERPSMKLLTDCLSRYSEEAQMNFDIKCYDDAESFLSCIADVHYDMVFMDIKMPGMDGMTAARKLREYDENVILFFVTDMAQMAVEGYEVNAFGFVIKPVRYYDFKLKLEKAVKKIKQRDYPIITVNEIGAKVYLDIKDLIWVEVIGHKIYYHTTKGVLNATGTLNAIEAELKKYNFSRCNSCFLVNLSYVSAVRVLDLELRNGDVIKISQTKRKNFMHDLTVYFGGGR